MTNRGLSCTCGLILRDDPAFAETLLAFPWFADGVTNGERNAAYYLRLVLRADPAIAKTLLGSPWLADGVSRNEEQSLRTLRSLRGLYETDLNSLFALNAKPWYKDGLSNEELKVVGYLASIARQSQADAQAIIDMPFLESVEIRDTLALESLSEIAEESVSDFRELMSHPRIKDGITDEETKIVAVLGQATYKYSPGSAQVLLAETGVYIQERLIELPHTGETLLAVIRVEDKVTPRMDHFEHAVRSIERFMGVPYPIDYLALLYYDNEMKNANNNFTHLLLMAEYDTVDGPRWHATVIAHEVAHWYWRSGQRWASEGSADFLRIISEHERTGRSLTPIKDPCPYFDSISELEKDDPKVNPQRVCWYSLGQRLFLDLYLALGNELPARISRPLLEPHRRLRRRRTEHLPRGSGLQGRRISRCRPQGGRGNRPLVRPAALTCPALLYSGSPLSSPTGGIKSLTANTTSGNARGLMLSPTRYVRKSAYSAPVGSA